MSAIDEIKRMQEEGRSEEEIAQILKQEGLSKQEIYNALSQSKIKDAVLSMPDEQQIGGPFESPEPQQIKNSWQYQQEQYYPQSFPEPPTPSQTIISPDLPQKPMTQELGGMEPSILNQPQEELQYQQPSPYSPQYPQEGYDYQYPSSISPDMISEISEQIVSEKLSGIRRQLEKNIDLKNTFSTQISSIDERLQRIEKIIDKLQLSIIQKVGEYGSSISDLKKEVIETQKSFNALSPKHHSHSQNYQHKHHEHHPPHKHQKSKH